MSVHSSNGKKDKVVYQNYFYNLYRIKADQPEEIDQPDQPKNQL